MLTDSKKNPFSHRDEIDFVCAVEEMSFIQSMVAFGVISLMHHFNVFLL